LIISSLQVKRGNLAVRTCKIEIATSPPFADSGRLLAMTEPSTDEHGRTGTNRDEQGRTGTDRDEHGRTRTNRDGGGVNHEGTKETRKHEEEAPHPTGLEVI